MKPPAARSSSWRAGVGRDDALFVQSQALGDPTRYRIFLAIRDAPAPVDVAALTARFGLNHNAIRQHLAKLSVAGLVVDELRPASGRGRPPRLYRLAPGAAERWGGASPNELLSLMLLDLVDSDVEQALAAGRAMGQRLARTRRAGASTPEALEAVAAQLGFEPQRGTITTDVDAGIDIEISHTADGRRGAIPGDAEIVLDHCPFAAAASSAPGVVCTLHRGIAEGVAETVGDGWRVVGLEAHAPEQAGCRIVIAAPT